MFQHRSLGWVKIFYEVFKEDSLLNLLEMGSAQFILLFFSKYIESFSLCESLCILS